MIINVQLTLSGDKLEHFDSLVSPSGSLATLLRIEEDFGETDIVAIDESFVGDSDFKKVVIDFILQDIKLGRIPLLTFTLFSYNAERTLSFIKELKSEFFGQIKIAVGGQLIPYAKDGYLANRNIDAVCEGDAEVILPELLADHKNSQIKKAYSGWVKVGTFGKFSGVSFERYYKIKERLLKQKEIFGFSQLIIQGPGGPGCAWAINNVNGPCIFCSIQNITVKNGLTLEEYLANELELQVRQAPDRLFDVANQFLPFLVAATNKEWLRSYIEIRNKLGIKIEKYVYLIASSIDEEVAYLLKEAGVIEVYIGIEHFHDEALRQQNKAYRYESIKRGLDALQKTGINLRAGVVIGAAEESLETLNAVRDGIFWVCDKYKDILKTIQVYVVEIHPGARIFNQLYAAGLCPELFFKLKYEGYLSLAEQRLLSYNYIKKNCKISPEVIFDFEKEMFDKLSALGFNDYPKLTK